MEYRPPKEVPATNHNVSMKNILVYSLQFFAGLVLSFIALIIVLNLSIRMLVSFAPVDFAKNYRDKKVDQLLAKKSQEDLIVQKSVEKIFDKLMKSLDEDVSLRLYVTNSDEFINAVAVPSGLVIIGKELVRKLSNERKIATILAHEIGHHLNKDTVSGIANALTYLAIYSVIGNSGSGGDMFIRVGNLMNLKFSRNAEYAADQFAFDLIQRTYGSTDGIVEAYQTLMQLIKDEGVDEEESYDFMQTHPDTEKRIEKLKLLINSRQD